MASKAPPSVRLIGVDCATVPARTGVAIGTLLNGRVEVETVIPPARDLDVAGAVAAALAGVDRAVVALDAPLGWPAALGAALTQHHPGDPITIHPDELFARATDRAIRARLGKAPLEVGADRIARTAVAALALLAAVRERTGLALPVHAAAGPLPAIAAAEVYPAALVAAGGERPRGGEATLLAKRALLAAAEPGALPRHAAALAVPDALDAALCVVAAADLALGRAVPPPPALRAAAAREGWIWAR